ncbi:MAG: EamA family transporter [Armatimonadota bacterium]
MADVKSLDWSALGLMGIAIALGIAGQLFMKTGMSQQRADSVALLAQAVLRPAVVAGLLCYAASACLYMVVLSRLDLSYVYPMVAIAQVGVMFFSWLLLKEAIPALRIVGMVVICLGVVLVALSPAPPKSPSVAHAHHVAEQ